MVEWTTSGINIEGDQRHAEIIVKQPGLEGASTLSHPGDRIDPKDLTDDEVRELKPEEATLYRAIVAPASYSSSDRADIGFAVK